MRRVLTVITALVTMLALSPAGPARADETVVVHGFDFPSRYEDFETAGFFGRSCSDPRQHMSQNALLRIGYSDDAPAHGERVHGFALFGGDAIGPAGFTLTPSTSVLDMRLKPADGSTTGLLIVVYFAPGDNENYWLGTSAITETGSEWRTVDGSNATYEWQQHETGPGTWTPVGGDWTVAEFVSAHGGDGSVEEGGGAYLGMMFGCDGHQFWFDGLRVGGPGDITTYDFEGALTATLIQASRSTITAGQGVVIRGAADPEVSAFAAGLELTLETRPFGQEAFEAVGTAATTDGDTEVPWAELTQRPRVHTEYRWVIAESQSSHGSVSPIKVVKVRTAVTAALADKTLERGDKLVVKGKTTPQKSGVATTLQRNVNGAWRKLATGRTKANGTYSFAHKVGSKGKWKVRVLVAASPGNLAGTSPARSATVR